MVGHKLSFEAALSDQHSEKRNKSFKGEEEGMSSDGIVGHNVALIEMMSHILEEGCVSQIYPRHATSKSSEHMEFLCETHSR